MRVSHVEVLAVALLCGLGMRDAAADDEIFADGFDGPKWYIDADSDGYGNPAVFVRSATQPAGYVANALDCDDSNAVVYPGAPDDPDGTFLDSNCDGIDGDIAKAVFVAPSGVDDGSCGSQAAPCQSPAFAITRLDALHTQIYLQIGAYPGPLTIGASASFYGGFDPSWHRGPVVSGGPNAQIVGASAPMASYGVQSFAIYVAPGVQALFAEVEVDAPLAIGQSGDAGLSSYALYVDNAIVEIDRALVNQADGADGGSGLAGVSASGTIADAGNGGPSVQMSVSCDNTSRGTGGAPSTNTCAGARNVSAGGGGGGGTMDSACGFPPDFNATNGIPGQNAAYVGAPPLGLGGGGGVGGNTCGPAQVGFDGAVSDGSGGAAGSGSMIAGGIWLAKSGGGGTLGENGGGGGGGGGAGGCDNGTDSWGAGGGGGGAGGCAAPTAGSGGGGGGGSFGVFAVGGNLVVNGTTFNRGHGGTGGQGGVTGQGEPGGVGGQGGPQTQGSPGAKGGNGGRGGIAGGGGGGQGGSVFAIYSLGSTVTSIANTFVGGIPGPGGSGGASALGPAAGQSGQTGAVGDVGTCAAPGGC